jgi:hypothetical protein
MKPMSGKQYYGKFIEIAEGHLMRYPDLSTDIIKQRVARSVAQIRPGDIVEAWLDCEPDPGKSTPLPVIVLQQPDLRSYAFIVKDLFDSTPYAIIFMYQWRIVGRVKDIDELLASMPQELILAKEESKYPSQFVLTPWASY